MSGSLQRRDRYIPSSTSPSRFHIEPPKQLAIVKKNQKKTRVASSGVALNVLPYDSFSVESPAIYTVAGLEHHDENPSPRVPPFLGALSHVSPSPPTNLAWSRPLMPIHQEQDEGTEGKSENLTISNEYESIVADALGVDKPRVFHYNTIENKKRNFQSYAGSNRDYLSRLEAPVTTPKKVRKIISHIPYRVLDAPGLRNDFYSNLVSWSSKTGKVAVGLADEVFVWSEKEGARQFDIPKQHGDVTSVVFSCGTLLAVGFRDGSVFTVDLETELVTSIYQHGEAICYLCWFPKDSSKLLVGDENGNVIYLQLQAVSNSTSSVVRKVLGMKSHTQQVCGKWKDKRRHDGFFQ